MADVNKSVRKRKSSCSDLIFEINGKDVSPFQSPSRESFEPEAKISRKCDIMENYDSNLSQNSIEINASIQEKLMELQDENMKLRKQLQEITCVCKCNLNSNSQEGTSDLVDAKEPSISVKFSDESIAETYKNKFTIFLQNFIELQVEENRLEMKAVKNVNMMCLSPEETSKLRRKRRKSKTKSPRDLFIVDTTPSITTKQNDVMYTTKYSFTESMEKAEKDDGKCTSLQTCFNCDKHHSLRDCPEPKDFTRINAARNKLKSQQTTKARYHLDEDQKYGHLKPGKISQKLREALNLRSNELPAYIYRMRMCGYPPGWMEDAKVEHSNISLFDSEGKEDIKKKLTSCMDPESVIEYPGFNTPMEEGVKDDHKLYNCHPYSEKCSKEAMLEYLKKCEFAAEDNLETCDMDLEASNDDVPKEVPVGPVSPTLTDLEKKKIELLAALDDNNTVESITEVKTKTLCVEENELIVLDETTDDVVVIEESQEEDTLIKNVDNIQKISNENIVSIDLSEEGEDNLKETNFIKNNHNTLEVNTTKISENQTETKNVVESNQLQKTANEENTQDEVITVDDDDIIETIVNTIVDTAVNQELEVVEIITDTNKTTENNPNQESALEMKIGKTNEIDEIVNTNEETQNNGKIINTVLQSNTENITNDEFVKIASTSMKNLETEKKIPSTPKTPQTEVVKKSSFGTPLVKSSSPYSHLPQLDKFSKDISPLINFENLPNSTGKYEQMTGILQKVRKTLKNLQDKS